MALTAAEKTEIFQKLTTRFNANMVDSLGQNRFSVYKRYQVEIDGNIIFPSKCIMVDDEGNIIPLQNEYSGIFRFMGGVAIVCIQKNPQILQTDTGLKSTDERKEGLIDLNSKELSRIIH
jgi:hypothetical protein